MAGINMPKYKAIVDAARKAKRGAYAPYSKFRVGAALKTKDGKIYTGCNIEISTYGLTLCAERVAIFKAFSEGERYFDCIAIVSDLPDFCPPCGACLQVLMDLAGNIDFVMANGKGKYRVLKLSALLPVPFGPDHLRRKSKALRPMK
jgi:cytidine deaminase